MWNDNFVFFIKNRVSHLFHEFSDRWEILCRHNCIHYSKLDFPSAIIRRDDAIFGIGNAKVIPRADIKGAFTKNRAAARTSLSREIGRKVGKWIVAKVAQLTFPSHFSRLILGSLRTSYSRLSACLSVCYTSISLHRCESRSHKRHS